MNTVQTRVLDKSDYAIVHEAVTKANRKAEKLGQPGFVLTSAPAPDREIRVEDPFNPGGWKVIGTVEQVEVTVTGTPPRIAGWTFVATLEWDVVSHEVVIKKIDGLDIDLTNARPQAEWCDHCNSRRLRTNTYLLVHDSGEFKQVGSTCLREFLGVEVHLNLLGFNPYAGIEDKSPINRPTRLATLAVFRDVLAITRAFGWVSAGAAYADNSKTSTKERLTAAYFDRSSKGLGEDTRKGAAEHIREDDEETAKAILEWVRTVVDNSEYVANLKAACAATEVREIDANTTVSIDTFAVTNLGLVVSAPYAYQRYTERQAARAAENTSTAHSEFQGTVKERLRGLHLTVKSTRYIDGDFGTSLLVVLADEKGNAFKWFATSWPQSLETVGATVVLDGTVKKHEIYNDRKSTVLTRCTVKEVVAA